jgi:hypothetical protein
MFTYSDVNSNFVPGTFGYNEHYISLSQSSSSVTIGPLQDEANLYAGTPYLFVSAGSAAYSRTDSGAGSGFMYLEIIVTYGVPYVVSVS